MSSELTVDLWEYKQKLDESPELTLEEILSHILSNEMRVEVVVHEGCKYNLKDNRFHITSATITPKL